MNNKTLSSALGCCWKFPPQFSVDKGVSMAEGIDAVLQSLHVLFITEPGERIMRETWGGGMNDMLFENISDELISGIENRIEENILRYEPRVKIKEIKIQAAKEDASKLLIQISVWLTGSNIARTVEGTLNLNVGQTMRLL